MASAFKQASKKNARGGFIRRAPFLISYWHDRQLFFENYLTRKKIAASMETAALLNFFSGWKPEEAMLRRWPEYTAASLRRTVRQLVAETFLQRSPTRNPPESSTERALRGWKAWNPAAGFFHLQTKDTYSEQITRDEIRWVEELIKRENVPAPTKQYSRTRIVGLRREVETGEYPRVLQERRTWREFGKKAVSNDAFGRLLHLSFGVQGWDEVAKGTRYAMKTSPSGGSLHPAEAYVLVRKVEGVRNGIYHYDAVGHRLQEIRRGANPAEIQKLLAGQWWFREAAFVVFLTAVFRRTQWKYDYARAYRAVLAEAGHLCQTFCLTATWLGLAPFCTMAMADTRIERALKVDGIAESVLYAMGAGTKIQKEKGKMEGRQDKENTAPLNTMGGCRQQASAIKGRTQKAAAREAKTTG